MYRTTVKVAIFCLIATLSISCKTKAQTTDTNVEKREQKRPSGQPPSVDKIFTQMDTNKDGKLAKSEVKGPLQRDFSKVDADGNGFISREELENAPKPNRRGGPPNRG